jgi:galactonate dehydratase
MKITNVKTFKWHPGAGKNFVYVKVETDSGIYGWGEAYTQSDRDTQVEAHILQLARYLEGRDPLHIRHFTHIAYEDFTTKRGGMDFHCAVSGIEIALWDIAGKAMGQPVYNLLGGPVRPRIRVYANGPTGKTAEETSKNAIRLVDEGYTALKFDPFPGPWRLYVDHEELEQAAGIVGAVREAVGPRVELLIEVHRRLSPANAIRMAKMIEKHRCYWFEEPCPSENLDAIKEVKDATTIPVVTGEALYTRAEFREVFEKRAASIINPDICNTGGILELTHIAAMAEPYYIGVSPHGWNSTGVGCAAAIHASAVMPNFLIYEYAIGVEKASRSVCSKYLPVVGGYIELPKDPGLGIDVDEAKLAQHPYKPFPKRAVRTVEDERKYDRYG